MVRLYCYITDTLKVYGGKGQETSDEYDLDAVYGFVVNYDLTYGSETEKVGIYSNINSMLDKKGKLLGNGKLTKQEEVTEGDAYIRIHFDAKIPQYVYGLTDIR